ncbi:hopanoid biosynthesis-associated RND transporter HpnN, partial [Methylobacterium sp. D48H]
ARLSWQALLSGGGTSVTDKMKFVVIQPVLDFNALEPGYQATKLIRNVAKDLGTDAQNGLRMRLTGTVAVADEEFATLSEDAGLNNSIIVGAI